MAEHLFIPKRLARALPWLKGVAWRIEAWAVRAVIALLRCFSPQRATALAMRVMRLLAPLLPMWDKVARNLAIAFPERSERERAALRREIFAHLGAAIAELVLSDRVWAERERRLEFVADPSIQGLQPGGRPIVFVTAHVGAWQFANFVAARYGFTLSTLYAPESNPLFADIVLRLRSQLPARWLPNKGAVRLLVGELRAGHSVGMATDTKLEQGEPVPFFGQPAMTNTVPARLALKLGCEMVPVRVERLGGARYRVRLHAPLRPRNASAPPDEQALDMSAQLNALFEQWIRETPGEWMCLARRFPKDVDKAARR